MLDGHLPEKGKAMFVGQSRNRWRGAIFAAAIALLAGSSAFAKDSSSSIKDAEQYVAKGNLKAAEIELRNAIREAPQDPFLHARLADVYLQLGDVVAAEREARTARDNGGNEADFLPVLADALLRQEKFADLADLVKPDDRIPCSKAKSGPHSASQRRA